MHKCLNCSKCWFIQVRSMSTRDRSFSRQNSMHTMQGWVYSKCFISWLFYLSTRDLHDRHWDVGMQHLFSRDLFFKCCHFRMHKVCCWILSTSFHRRQFMSIMCHRHVFHWDRVNILQNMFARIVQFQLSL